MSTTATSRLKSRVCTLVGKDILSHEAGLLHSTLIPAPSFIVFRALLQLPRRLPYTPTLCACHNARLYTTESLPTQRCVLRRLNE
jgi:hypothetical protein